MNNITIYTKDYCPFCIKAKSLLTMKKIKFTEINLNENPDQFDKMLEKSNGARTVPQIFNDNNYIGDCDKIYELNSEGILNKLLGI
jgi:glutaredoxin 3